MAPVQPRAGLRCAFSKSSPALLIALGLLPAFASHAQEAWLSEQSVDAAINSRTNTFAALQPDSIRAGPVLLNLGTYVGVTFDDNINTSQNDAKSDTSIHAGVSFGLDWPARENSHVQLASDLGYVTYLAHTRSDSIEIAPNSALTWNMSFEDGTLTFYDQFDYSDEVITLPSVAGLNSLPRLENTIGAKVQWSPDKWRLEAGLSHADFYSPDSAFKYLNRGSEYFSLKGAWSFAENTLAGMEFSASQTDYQITTQSDSTSYSLGPYASWNVTEFITADISGGPTIYRFDAAGFEPASTLTSYYFNFDLSHKLTEFITQRLTTQRSVSLGYEKGNQYTELLSFTYALNWNATRNANVELSLTYENGKQPLILPSVEIENFHRVGISTGMSYRLTEKLGGGVHFSHWDRISDISGNNYTENSISFQMNYSF